MKHAQAPRLAKRLPTGDARQRKKIFSLQPKSQRTVGQKAASVVGGVLERALGLDRIDRLYEKTLLAGGDGDFVGNLLRALGVSCAVSDQDLARVPKSGPVVVVSNHPFGIADPLVVWAALHRVRSDVKILANRFLASVPELHPLCIFVDPFGREDSPRANVKPLKEALRHLAEGGVLEVFPAGEVASANLRQWKVVEPAWKETIARIIRHSAATVLPVYVRGTNSPLFHAAGLVHPRLRTALLPHEFLAKRGHTIRLAIGSPIPFRKLEGFQENAALLDHLRERTYLLGSRRVPRKSRSGSARRRWSPLTPLVPPSSRETMADEIRRLPSACRLVSHGEFGVYCAEAGQIPTVLREIGRLREMTFRVAAEGTGKPLDLDEFDDSYRHLFIWHEARREVVGAYRIGRTDEILQQRGLRGLYTSTLFHLKPELLRRIHPALELGRSFVRPEYQRTSAALALLWKGIAHYVLREPRYRFLFGPVSISNDYQRVSHHIMVGFLRQHSFLPDEAKLVRAKKVFRARRRKGWTLRLSRLIAGDIEDISSLVSDIESDGKGVPVLLRQYLKLGGGILGFNVDTDFSNVVDSLILVDLTATDRRVLDRYMGKEGAQSFLRHHGTGVSEP